jgi:Cu/Ag efflux protein CusF
MARITVFICFALLLSAPLTHAAAQTKTLQGDVVTMAGTVEAIDTSRRILTIKDRKGEYHDVDVPETMTSFSSTKVGDRVTLRYYDNVVLQVKRPGTPDLDTASGAVTRSTTGQAAGTVAGQRTITATITAIDPKVPSITFSGPNNWTYSSRVQDRKALSQVKVGDKVDITWTAAVLASLDPAK